MSVSCGARAQLFAADAAHSEWLASSTPVCSLSHTIPGFGKAVFVHNPAGAGTFYIEQQGKVIFPVGAVTIETMPPVWRSNIIPLHLGNTTSVAGSKPIVLNVSQFQSVLDQLAKGINIVFSSQLNKPQASSSANAGVMRIVLEAKNFSAVYKNFQLCSGDSLSSQPDKQTTSSMGEQASISGQASAQTFEADIKNADWVLSVTPFACSLTHDIPNFGKAVLSHKAGGSELFYLEPQNTIIFPVGDTRFETAPPPWRSDVAPASLGKLTSVIGKQPVTVIADQLTQLLGQLTAGVNIMFVSQSSSDKSSRANVMRVLVGAKNFSVIHKNYQQCVNDLIPYSFAQLSRTLINYPEKSEGLSAAVKSELAKVARYVKADSKVTAVLIDAHSDNLGTPEERDATTKQQAEWVAAYLETMGVAAEKIATRWHADKFPIGDNKTAAGRAQNRRITVRLEDEAMRLEAEKKSAAEKLSAEKNNNESIKKEQSTDTKISSKNSSDDTKKVEASSSKNNKDTETKKNSSNAIASAISNSASNNSTSSNSVSNPGKITPEQINKMVEGLDLVEKKH